MAAKEQSVKVNFAYNLCYQVLAVILPLISTPYLTRTLGPDGFGSYSFSFSIANYFAIFILLGINNHGSRTIAKVRSSREEMSKAFLSIYSIQIGMALVVIAIYASLLLARVFDYAEYQAIWMLYLLSGALDINWFFFGLEQFEITVTRNFVIKILTFLGLFVVVHSADDLGAYIWLMACGMLAAQIVVWPFLIKQVSFVKIGFSDIKENIAPAFVLFIPVAAVSVYTVFDKVLLGGLSGTIEAGYFDSALKIATVPTLAITALGSVMLPRISNLLGNGKEHEAERYFGVSMRFVLALSAFSVFGLLSAVWEFAPLYYGQGFEPCAAIIAIIVLDVPFFAWANVLRNQYLIPAKRDGAFVASVVFGAVVNLVSNIILIPSMGAIGAAIGTVLAEASVCIFQSMAIRKELPLLKYIRESFPYFVIGAGLFSAVRILAEIVLWPSLAIRFAVEVIVYVFGFALYFAALIRKSGSVKAYLFEK